MDLLAEEVEDADGESIVLAVVNEVSQSGKTLDLGLLVGFCHGDDRVDDGALQGRASLVGEGLGEELKNRLVLGGELDDDDLEGIDDDSLEVIIELLHVLIDASEDLLNVTFSAGLQDGRDGESGDVAVSVSNQAVKVADGATERLRMNGGDSTEESDGGEAHDGAVGGEVELEDDSDGGDLLGAQAAERHERLARFKHDHVAVMVSHVVHKLEELEALGEVLLHELGAEADQQAQRERRAERPVLCLGDEAENRDAITLAELVEERQSVVLNLVAFRFEDFANFGGPALDHLGLLVRELDTGGDGGGGDVLVLVEKSLLDVALHGSNDAGITNLAESADGVGLENVVGRGHVLDERGRRDEDLFGSVAEFSQKDEEHAANLGVLALEEFGGSEEDVCGFLSGESVASAEEIQDIGHALEALGHADGDGVECNSTFLKDGALFKTFEGHGFLLFIVGSLLVVVTIFVVHSMFYCIVDNTDYVSILIILFF